MELVSVALATGIDRDVLALKDGHGGFAPTERVRELHRALARAAGEISSSLYLAARTSGLPDRLIMEMIRVLSWDVDFQRDIQKGHRFEVVYERDRDETGRVVRLGKIQYVRLDIGGKPLRYWRYRPSDDKIPDYFDAKGHSIRKALLRTPVDGAKLTSRFGKRRHPILGYTRVHRGVDFGAPKGTPIYAAGDGMIEVAKWEGNYGRYVRMRHNQEIKTAYAHMSRIAKGIRKGKRVRQGQIIGFVGSTGLSTGPHLHYEVISKGRKTNPLSVKLPTGRHLKGKELKRFEAARANLDRRIAEIASKADLAAAE